MEASIMSSRSKKVRRTREDIQREQQALLAKTEREIDAIVAVPQWLGREAGVPTPHLDQTLALLKERARQAGVYGAG